MEAYIGDSFTILVDGQQPQCLQNLTFSDSADVLPYITGDVEWKKSIINLQGYELSIDGVGIEGYRYLRGLKRAKTAISWSYTTTQGSLAASGTALITSVSKAVNASEEIGFSARLLGRLNPT